MQTKPFRASLAQGTTLTRVEGKDVLFSVKTGESFGLNEMAAEMLKLLFAGDSASAAKAIAAEYAAPEAEIANDMAELAESLAAAKLVVISR